MVSTALDLLDSIFTQGSPDIPKVSVMPSLVLAEVKKGLRRRSAGVRGKENEGDDIKRSLSEVTVGV